MPDPLDLERCGQCGGPLDELNDCPECDLTTEAKQEPDLPAAIAELAAKDKLIAELRGEFERHRTCPECNHKMIPADCPVEAQLDTARQEIERLKGDLELERHDSTGLRKSLAEAHEACRQRHARIGELQLDRDKALRVAEELRREVTEWEGTFATADALNASLIQSVENRVAERDSLRGLVDEMAGLLKQVKMATPWKPFRSAEPMAVRIDGIDAVLEKHTALKAGRETDSHNYRELLEWSLSVVGYYLDFHAQPGHANYDAKGLCFALHSYLKTPWAIKNAAAQKKEG